MVTPRESNHICHIDDEKQTKIRRAQDLSDLDLPHQIARNLSLPSAILIRNSYMLIMDKKHLTSIQFCSNLSSHESFSPLNQINEEEDLENDYFQIFLSPKFNNLVGGTLKCGGVFYFLSQNGNSALSNNGLKETEKEVVNLNLFKQQML